MSEVVEDQRPAMSYIPGWNEYIAWSREHRDYAGDPTETIASTRSIDFDISYSVLYQQSSSKTSLARRIGLMI
jgi:hypothetical protein